MKVLERYNKIMQTKAQRVTLDAWVQRWSDGASGKAAWTRALIRNLKSWIERKHGELGFAMAQFLTGHGCFQQYLFRMKKVGSPACLYGDATVDDAEHTLFICGKWTTERSALLTKLDVNTLTVENLVHELLESEDKWRYIREYMENIIEVKQKESNRNRAQ